MKKKDVFASKNAGNTLVEGSLHYNKCNVGRKSTKFLLCLALGVLLFGFGCKQANNGGGGGKPTPSSEITITLTCDAGLQVKTPGTFKVKKNSIWQDIKKLAESKITPKENKEIKEWRLKNIDGKVLVDSDKFEKDEIVFAVSKDKDIPEPPTPPANSITITIETDEGYTFKEGGSPCTIKVEKGVAWSSVKTLADAKIELKEGYEKTGWKLGGKDGSYLKDAFVFNSDAKVFATSKKKGEPDTPKITITVKGDEGVTIGSPESFNVDKGSKWINIKVQALAVATPKDDFEIASWHLKDEAGEVLEDKMVFNENATVFATSKRKIASYKVEHLQENVENDEYTTYESEEKEGEAGKNTNAEAKQYDGFLAQSFAQSLIKEDGSTVVQIKYKRKITSLILNLDGGDAETKLEDGKDGNKLLKGKFGAKVEVKGLKKEKHGFEKWEPALPSTFPKEDDNKNIYTAKWTRNIITITVQGDDNIKLASPNTTDVAKGGKWKDIKTQVSSLATAKEDFEIASWHVKDAQGEVLKDEKVFNENETVFAKSKRKVVTYKVEHLRENIENDECVLYESEDKEGEAGKNTSAEAKQYDGFIAQPFAQSLIKANGSTVVQIKYKRKMTSLIIDLQGGETTTTLDNENGKTLLRGKFGASVSITTPTKDNHTFEKWEPALPATFPKDDDPTIYVAKWTQDLVTITVKGDEGINLVSPNTTDVAKGGKWKDIKTQVSSLATPKEDFEIASWHLKDAQGEVLKDEKVFNEDAIVFATSKRKVSTYKVEHLQENIENDEYTTHESENKEGEAGKNTSAEAKTYEGFLAQSFTQSLIKVDGSTVVQIKYKRKMTSLIIDLQGGETTTTLDNENGKTLLRGKFGASVSITTPTKDNHTFEKWEPALPSTFPKENDTQNTYKAKWTRDVITITVEGDEGITVKGSGKVPVNKGSRWSEIKGEVERKIEVDKNFEIKEWRLKDKNGEIIGVGDVFKENKTVFAVSKRKIVKYTVEHKKENADDAQFSDWESEEKQGEAGTNTEAVAKQEEGFESPTPVQKTIEADGSTVVRLEYKRKRVFLIIDLQGGNTATELVTEGGKTLLKGKYGARLEVKKPTKENYDFEKWEPPLPTSFPIKDDTEHIYTAKWKKNTIQIYIVGEDERLNVTSPVDFPFKTGMTWADIKEKMKENVSLKPEWQGGDYELYDWRAEGDEGEEITDERTVEDGMKVYPRSNYTKFKWDQNDPTVLIGCTGGKPRGKIIIPTKTTTIGEIPYIEPFKNCEELTALDCRGCRELTKVRLGYMQITNVDLSQCSKLTEIYFSWCKKLKSVNLTGCSELAKVDWYKSGITSIDLSPCTKLTEIRFIDCEQIKSVDLKGLSELAKIYLKEIPITSIDLSPCPKLTEIRFINCRRIKSVDLKGLSELAEIYLERIPTTSIDLSPCPKLTEIRFIDCERIKSVDLKGLSELAKIYLKEIPITSIDLSPCSKVKELSLRSCEELESMNLTGCSELQSVEVVSAKMYRVDLSGFPKLTNVRLSSRDEKLGNVNLAGCSELKTLKFDNCPGLWTVDLTGCSKLDVITDTGSGSGFYNCRSLKFLRLAGCSGLTKVDITRLPIIEIDLSNCTKLTEINFEESETLDSVNLAGCSELKKIRSETFYKCIRAEVKLPTNINEIEGGAFGYDESSWCKEVLVPRDENYYPNERLIRYSGYPADRIRTYEP